MHTVSQEVLITEIECYVSKDDLPSTLSKDIEIEEQQILPGRT